MPEPVASWYQTFTRAFRNAFPIILFFLTAFCTVYLFFGLSYVILVSIITVFFHYIFFFFKQKTAYEITV